MAHEFYRTKPEDETHCHYPLKHITYEMCLKAFQEDKWVFPWIPEHHKTEELCKLALEKFGNQAYNWIPKHINLNQA